jgi:2-haloacid dehalogenase
MIKNIRACVFDAYGTLFDVHSAVAAHRERLGQVADAVSASWRSKQLEYTWLRSLMQRHADFWQVTAEALDYALELHGIDAGADDAALHDALMQSYLQLQPYPEVAATLSSLRTLGLKLAILSNGSPAMLDAAVHNAEFGDTFQAVLSVEELGIYKPDPRVYALAVERLGIAAAEILFLSSNAWDVAGAANFGFQVVWVNRFAQPRERLPGNPLSIISDLASLPSLLEPDS